MKWNKIWKFSITFSKSLAKELKSKQAEIK